MEVPVNESPDYHAGYQAGRADGLDQRCQHHFAYWNTWWGFFSFCIVASAVIRILNHLLGWN